MYSGKVLETITHKEKPWINARKNYEPGERSDEIISKMDMKNYYLSISNTFELDNVESMQHYIRTKL